MQKIPKKRIMIYEFLKDFIKFIYFIFRKSFKKNAKLILTLYITFFLLK